MENVKHHFKGELGEFDTPKKLNRSTKKIPQSIIDQLEGGKVTFEMIQELKGQFPIFLYKSCLTIHGEWGDIKRSRIVYKNIIQNQNGSLEVLWSAIDLEAFKKVGNMLYHVRDAMAFNYRRNLTSKGKNITLYRNFKNQEELTLCISQLKEIAKKLKGTGAVGSFSVYRYSFIGIYTIEMSIDLYLIPNPNELAFALCNTTEEGYNEMTKAQNAINEAYELERQKEREEWKKKEEEFEARKLKFALPIASLPKTKGKGVLSGVIVSVGYIRFDKRFCFEFYRSKKGSFGRIAIEKATSKTFSTDMEVLEWKAYKQVKSENIHVEMSGDFHALPIQEAPKPKPNPITTQKPIAIQNSVQVSGVTVIEYSDKCLAITGDTKAIKEDLKRIGARFNPKLSCGVGWVLPIAKKDLLKQIGITY